MAAVAIQGNDSIILTVGGVPTVLSDFGKNGDIGTLTFDDDLWELYPSKNGNVVYVYKVSGKLVKMEINLILNSPNDKLLNSLSSNTISNPASTVLFNASLIKETGDGQGNVTNTKYNLIGGVISRNVDAKINVAGDEDQALAKWNFKFATAERLIV